MRVVQVAEKNGPLQLAERDLPEPGPGEVRIKIEACGVCHSDSLAVEGTMPGATFPRVPGHEIAGRIDAVGQGVQGWTVGSRVGVGWFGGACYRCEPCRRGHHIDCRNLRIPGINYDGGYAEAMVCPADALAAIDIDSGAEDPAAALQALGGAKTILATVPSGKAISPLVGGLAVRGKLVVIGVSPEPIEVPSFAVIGQSASVVGHASGTSIESEDTMRFSAMSGVRPMIETMPLEQAPAAYAKMMRGEARFRMVLTMDAG